MWMRVKIVNRGEKEGVGIKVLQEVKVLGYAFMWPCNVVCENDFIFVNGF